METRYKCTCCDAECETYDYDETYTDDAWGQVETFTDTYTLSACCDADAIELAEGSDEDE